MPDEMLWTILLVNLIVVKPGYEARQQRSRVKKLLLSAG